MRRREFITLLGGAVAAWPIRSARAAVCDASYRIFGCQHTFKLDSMDYGFLTGIARAWLDRGPHS